MKQEELDRTFKELEVVSNAEETSQAIVSMLDNLFIDNFIVNNEGMIESHNADTISDYLKVIRTACMGMAQQLNKLCTDMDKRATLTRGEN